LLDRFGQLFDQRVGYIARDRRRRTVMILIVGATGILGNWQFTFMDLDLAKIWRTLSIVVQVEHAGETVVR
jgi:hypothetical protein